MPVAFDFRIDDASVAASRASIDALGRALSAVTLSDNLTDQLRDLAPCASASSAVVRVVSEACQHGAVTIVESRLAPGDAYLDFIAALLSEHPGLRARYRHGWPILSLRPVRAADASGVECLTFDIETIAKATAVDPGLLRGLLAMSAIIRSVQSQQ